MNHFNVLLVEDDQTFLDLFERAFPRDRGPVRLRTARSFREARARITESFFHVALVDVVLEEADPENQDGTFVLRDLADRRPSCRRIAFTGDRNFAVREWMRVANPLVHGIIWKPEGEGSGVGFIKAQAAAWLMNPVNVAGLEAIAAELRLKLSDPKPSAEELDYLVSRIFGQGEPTTNIRAIDLKLLTGGRSRSAVVYGQPCDKSDRRGIWAVIKFSGREAAREEYRAYCEHVRYMLPLSLRVELLGYYEADTVGAMCYSFVGGEPGAEILSLEEMIRRQDDETFRYLEDAMKTLGRHWYSRTAEETIDQWSFGTDRFHIQVEKVLDKTVRFANRLAPQLGATLNAEMNGLSVGRLCLHLPTPKDLAQGHLRERPRCTIHGDLHAGNLLVRKGLEGGAVVIDYQYTGPGPAYLDFAALDASARVSSAAGTAVGQPAVEEQAAVEPRLWEAAWATPPGGPPPDGLPFWARVSHRVLGLLRETFPGLSPDEYAGTCLVWAVRLFKVDVMDDAARLRILVWASHLLSVLRTPREIPQPGYGPD